MRTILKLLICFAVLLPLTAFCQSNTNLSHRISSRTKYPISYWFGHPGGAYTELRIDGKRFDHVRGERTFYLQIPGGNSIVFINAVPLKSPVNIDDFLGRVMWGWAEVEQV